MNDLGCGEPRSSPTLQIVLLPHSVLPDLVHLPAARALDEGTICQLARRGKACPTPLSIFICQGVSGVFQWLSLLVLGLALR